jgi:hypothetical protein
VGFSITLITYLVLELLLGTLIAVMLAYSENLLIPSHIMSTPIKPHYTINSTPMAVKIPQPMVVTEAEPVNLVGLTVVVAVEFA